MRTRKTILWIVGLCLLISLPAAADITKGPYLQNLDIDRVTICFETDLAGQGAVEVGADVGYGETFTGQGAEFTHEGVTVYQYKIAIDDRAADTLYHYRVVHGGVTTEDFSFITEPDHLTPFRFVVFGDSRGGAIGSPNLEHEAAIAAIIDESPALYFNTGDLVSAGANLDNWAYFFTAEHDLMAHVPLYPIFGNHEDDEENGLTGDDNWGRYFAPPDANRHPTYYSFDYLNAHFVVIDVEKWETLLVPDILQNGWLRDDLDAANENPKTNFTFAFLHEPPFSYKEGRTGNTATLLILNPIFRDYGVDAVFEGHDHFYARHEMGGINHIVTGGGGAPLYDFQPWPQPQTMPGYHAHDKSNHYMVIDLEPEIATLRSFRLDGTLIDEFTLERDPPVWPADDDTVDDDTVDDDTGDDDTLDDDTVDDDTGDDDEIDDDATDDDAVDDDAVDDDAIDDDAADDDAVDDDDDDDDGCGC